jgi:hypothetical protein
MVDMAEGVVRGVVPPSPRPFAAATEEILGSGQLAAASQGHDSLEGTTSAASPEIKEPEEGKGAALSQGTMSTEAQALELAFTLWAAAFEDGDDTEDDEEVAACNTFERGLAWAH